MNYTDINKLGHAMNGLARGEEREEICERVLLERYDEMLDECFGVVSVAGISYDTSNLLKSTDPITYRCGFNDWLDAEITDGRYEEIDGKIYEKE